MESRGEFFLKLVLLSLARESVEEKGGYARRRMNLSRSVEGWEEGFTSFIYAPVFTGS